MIAAQLLLLLATAAPAEPQKPVSSLSEMPAKFTPTTSGLDHERREVMIPMDKCVGSDPHPGRRFHTTRWRV